MSPSPPAHPMPLRRNIKTPKRYEDELVDTSISMGSRGRLGINTVEAAMQTSGSSQTPSKRSSRPKKNSKAPKSSASNVQTSRSTPTPKKAQPKKSHSEDPVSDCLSPRQSRVPKNTYTGPQTEYNPNLPPATFPTLDNAKRVQEYEQKLAAEANENKIRRPSTDSHAHGSGTQPTLGTQRPTPSDFNQGLRSQQTKESLDHTHQPPKETGHGFEHSHPFRPRTCNNPANGDTTMGDQRRLREAITAENIEPARRTVEPSEESQNSMYEENVNQLQGWARMTSLERDLVEMRTSDEDEVSAIKRSKKPATSRAELWDSLPSFLKVHAVDSVYEQFPNQKSDSIFENLQLTDRQVVEMTELINERTARGKNEDAVQAKLHAQVQDFLLHRHGRSLSQTRFRTMLNDTIYHKIEEGDPVVATRRMWRNAKDYLELCGLPGSLLDDEDGPTELISVASTSKVIGG